MRPLSIQGMREILLPRSKNPTPDRASAAARAAFGPLPLTMFSRKNRDLATFLGEVALFADFTPRELVRLARHAHERTYGDGEYVYREGNPGAALFLVRAGVVEITRRDTKGNVVPILALEAPASFSEQAAIGIDVPRWTSAVARGPVSLVALGKSDLDALGRHAPLLANKVLGRVAQILVARVEALIDMQLEPGEAPTANDDVGK